MADLYSYSRGIRTIVDLTTVDLGRDIGLVVDVARRSRGRVIVATGVWAQARPSATSAPTASMRRPICSSATSPRALARAASRQNILRASARAQKATGVPISTHTWAAGRSGEAQQAIFAQEGVDLRRVIIGHSGDSDDLGYLRGLMERGSTTCPPRNGSRCWRGSAPKA